MNFFVVVLNALKDVPELWKTYPKTFLFVLAVVFGTLVINPNNVRDYFLAQAGISAVTQHNAWVPEYVEKAAGRLLVDDVYNQEEALELLDFMRTYKNDVPDYQSSRMFDLEIGLRIKYNAAITK